MLRKVLTIIVALLFHSTVFANYSQIQSFSQQLSRSLLINLTHLSTVADSIRISKAGGIQLWMMNRSGAEATYNDILNQILLRPENFIGSRLKALSDYPEQTRYQFYPLASTIFHELSHADYDVYIENNNISIRSFMQSTLTSWFRKNFPKHNAKISTHELFGYTAGESILALNYAITDLLTAHGINIHTKKCFSKIALERIAKRLDLYSGVEFKPVKENFSFYQKIVADVIFVKGKDLDLRTKNFPDHYKRTLYDYFIQQYDMPRTYHDLIDKLNHSTYATMLKQCYKDIVPVN